MTNDVKLLPLPEPVEYVFAAHDNAEGYGMATAGKCYYTPDQVRDYARANLSPLKADVSDLMQAAVMLAVERAEFRIRAERLAEALRPFAALYHPDDLASHHPNEPDRRAVYGINAANITLGDLRRANTLLREQEPSHD